jgi:hypothetical protein
VGFTRSRPEQTLGCAAAAAAAELQTSTDDFWQYCSSTVAKELTEIQKNLAFFRRSYFGLAWSLHEAVRHWPEITMQKMAKRRTF